MHWMPERIIPKQILSVVIAISCNCKQLDSLRDMIYDTTIYFISILFTSFYTIKILSKNTIFRYTGGNDKSIIYDTIWVYEDYDLQTVDGRSFLNMDHWRSWETYNIIKPFQVAYMMGMTKGFQ